MTDEVIKNLESKRITTVEVEIDASEEIDRAIKCWEFIKRSIQSKFGKTLLSPKIALDTEDLDCIEVNLSWETPENILVIRVIEKRYVSAYVYYEDYKEKLQKWYTIEDELPDWFVSKLLLFTE